MQKHGAPLPVCCHLSVELPCHHGQQRNQQELQFSLDPPSVSPIPGPHNRFSTTMKVQHHFSCRTHTGLSWSLEGSESRIRVLGRLMGSSLSVLFSASHPSSCSMSILLTPGSKPVAKTKAHKLWPTVQIWPISPFFWKLNCIGTQPFVYELFRAAMVLNWQSWIVATETIYLVKPKVFIIWPFTENACQTQAKTIAIHTIKPIPTTV